MSLLAIVLLTAGYEAVREASRRYEAYASKLGERRSGDDVRGECRHISYTRLGRDKHGVEQRSISAPGKLHGVQQCLARSCLTALDVPAEA